ncbi:MAG TPA: CoB--CoM heterodisulfide reductase iron-sulfur subunit A family protein, partial [Anaerolineae bacterium]|nr:CoB--CoM heterodisulfide reductase iron-sulfur subunit A family protein [Anaerolineae bacterium]
NNLAPGSNRNSAVLVVGAGIAGMEAALLLAEVGHKVYLLDSAPGIGGSMHLLDVTFPTDSCGICIMLPDQPAYCPPIECSLHRNIEILAYAELESLSGEPGAFTAIIRHKPRYVDMTRCNNCALCVEVCPEERPHPYESNLAPQKAIYRPPTRAMPDTYLIDMDYCTRCGQCVEVCPTEAIDLNMEESHSEVEVGAILLTPGFAPFDARLKGEFGYGYYDNVLSSIEFERMVSLAGSTQARLKRPSDGKPPRRLAFIHCVGSRDNNCGAGYCTSVCCMYTAKQVSAARKLDPDLEVAVFFMDIRAFGKDFERYFDKVQSLPGVTYRRSMVSSIHQYQQSRNLHLSYVGEDGTLREEDFDMVVLAVGFAPPEGFQKLGQALGIEQNEYGFAVTGDFTPTLASRPGVFVGGAFREPKDVPETVIEAAAAAAEVARLLANLQPPISNPQLPTFNLRDVSDEEPRVGVFVCNNELCNGGLNGLNNEPLIDTAQVTAHAQSLWGVALAQVVEDACTPEGLAAIEKAIAESQLNRVVIAGCSSRLYSAEFEELVTRAGLDPRLMERANLREQCAYVHDDPATATAKAQSLVAMAVAKLVEMRGLEALSAKAAQPVQQRVLVIGGGLAGMTAALNLAGQGIAVDLVERESELGGQLRHIRYLFDPEADPQALLESMIAQVGNNDLISVHRQAEVKRLEGSKGSYRSVVKLADGEEVELEHGAVIVATGGQEARPQEYLYGQDPRVITQRELEKRLADGQWRITNPPRARTPSSAVMIQCVGSREPERPYCSRICCTQAVKNALKIKEQSPETDVYILYREVRTYGFREQYYQQARDRGVAFIRYELPDKPRVSADGDRLQVRVTDPILKEELALDADLVVLSVGIAPNDNRALAEVLEVPLNEDGFFQEDHPKMRPLDFTRAGIFLCGLAHSPRFLDETIAQASGAAMRAAALLAPAEFTDKPEVVTVNERLCSFCGLCVSACPYGARIMDYENRVAQVIEVLCQGCGNCAMVCPNKATQQKAFEPRQLMAMIDAAM